MDETSITLLGRLMARDESAWADFNSLYAPFVRGWAGRLQIAELEDVTQDVLLAVFRSLPSFKRRHAGAFHGWLRGVVRNVALEHLKRARRRPTTDQQGLLDALEDAASEMSRVWAEDHERHLLSRALEVARAESSEAGFRAFYDTAVLGKPADEVAVAIGMTVGAVRMAKYRVQKRIKELASEFLQ